MRYINRIVYALSLALVLMIILSVVREQSIRSSLNKISGSYEDGAYDAFLPTRYHGKELIIEEEFTFNNETYQIIGYEVIGVFGDLENSYVKDEGIYFLIIGPNITKNKELNMKLYANTVIEDGKESYGITIDYKYGIYNKKVPIFINMLEVQPNYFTTTDFTKDKIEYKLDKIVIEESITIDVNFGKEDFTLKSEMEEYILQNKNLPSESTGNIVYSKPLTTNAEKNIIITLIIYIIIVIPISYFIYKPRKNLGSNEATIGVQQDIEKLKR